MEIIGSTRECFVHLFTGSISGIDGVTRETQSNLMTVIDVGDRKLILQLEHMGRLMKTTGGSLDRGG